MFFVDERVFLILVFEELDSRLRGNDKKKGDHTGSPLQKNLRASALIPDQVGDGVCVDPRSEPALDHDRGSGTVSAARMKL